MNFCINLTQFYINFSRQKHQIELLWVDQSTPEMLRVHFSFTVPFKVWVGNTGEEGVCSLTSFYWKRFN